jgi:DNA-binding CsgD family transcriptional regulator
MDRLWGTGGCVKESDEKQQGTLNALFRGLGVGRSKTISPLNLANANRSLNRHPSLTPGQMSLFSAIPKPYDLPEGATMAEREVEQQTAALKALPLPAILTNLADRKFLAVNDRAGQLFGVAPEQLVGVDAASTVVADERVAVERAYRAMATGAIDGYQVQRRIVLPDRSERVIVVWGRRVEGSDGPYGLWILMPEAELRGFADLATPTSSLVIAMTDHDWQIDYVSADPQLMGASARELHGAPLLGFVHPSVAAEFLQAAASAVTDRMAVTVKTRLRAGPDGWEERYVLLVPMCEHEPPRLGVVVTAGPLTEGTPEPMLRPHLAHSALEADARGALRALPSLADNPAAADLSPRQVQIISHLIDGENVDGIARALYLSPSTVRNHLTAIYRKFGVHSQAELLAALLRAGVREL